jgi:hypothetical protein
MSNQEHNPKDEPAEFSGLLEEVQHVLSFSTRRDQETLELFGKGSTAATGKNARFKLSGPHQYYNESQIRSICVRYRLRFLSIQLFAGEVPYEVLSTMKSYVHRHSDVSIVFHILAPTDFFLLKNQYAAPLLFASNSDGQFELICQWGNQLPWFIPIIRYPYRDFRSMVISSLVVGAIVTMIAALNGIMVYDSLFKSILLKIPILVLSSGIFSTLALCYGLVTHTDFSSDNWNSRFFNK